MIPRNIWEKACLGPFVGPGEVCLQGQKHHKHMKESLQVPKQRDRHGRDEKGPDFPHTSIEVRPTKGCPPPLPLLTERWMDSHIPQEWHGKV